MRAVFLDTVALVAVRDESDRHHQEARLTFRRLIDEGLHLITSNYVFAETYTLLLVRSNWDEAIKSGRALRSGDLVEVVRVEGEVESEAWHILETHSDKKWSYVDATSFALMDRLGVQEAFTFDHHFAQRGLVMIPGEGT